MGNFLFDYASITMKVTTDIPNYTTLSASELESCYPFANSNKFAFNFTKTAAVRGMHADHCKFVCGSAHGVISICNPHEPMRYGALYDIKAMQQTQQNQNRTFGMTNLCIQNDWMVSSVTIGTYIFQATSSNYGLLSVFHFGSKQVSKKSSTNKQCCMQ